MKCSRNDLLHSDCNVRHPIHNLFVHGVHLQQVSHTVSTHVRTQIGPEFMSGCCQAAERVKFASVPIQPAPEQLFHKTTSEFNNFLMHGLFHIILACPPCRSVAIFGCISLDLCHTWRGCRPEIWFVSLLCLHAQSFSHNAGSG